MLGQKMNPLHWDPLAEALPLGELQGKATQLRESLHRAIARMPTHADFIDKNCRA
jgi:tryptophan 7-halogenase